MVALDELERKLIELKAKKSFLEKSIQEKQNQFNNNQSELDVALQARVVVQTVAEQTQKLLEFNISNLVTLALNTVFPDKYEFKLRFTQRRNKTECDFVLLKDGNEITDILYMSGGGLADIVSFALRLSLWSIKKSSPIQIMDEPFKFVSADLQDKCSEMLKQLSKELGIQIIMVSHLPNIIGSADKVIEIKDVKGVERKVLRRRI